MKNLKTLEIKRMKKLKREKELKSELKEIQDEISNLEDKIARIKGVPEELNHTPKIHNAL